MAVRSEAGKIAERSRKRIYSENLRKFYKKAVLEAYGGKCACCGESEQAFLCIDHIENNGAVHRLEIGQGKRKIGSGSVIYRWLVKNNFPQGFQILCANCNLAKQSLGYCPHHACVA